MFWYFGKSKKSLFTLSLSNGSRGFSLLELIVVIAIFLIITAVVIVDIPNFREKSSLDLTASEVATYIRGAQVYGAAQVGVIADNLSVSYGVHFDKDSSSFFLFKNTNNTVVEPYQMNGFKVAGIMTRDNSNNYKCDYLKFEAIYKSNSYTQSIGTVLEAEVSGDDSPVLNLNYADLKIKGIRNQALETCVRIYVNGQIANTNCDNDSFNKCS